MGLLLEVKVLPAKINDRKGGQLLLDALRSAFPKLKRIWADQGYTGEFKRCAESHLELAFEVVYPWWRQIEHYLPDVYAKQPAGFKVIPRRWVVERTFAWWTFQRPLNRDYDLLPTTTESFIYLAMIRLMLRRLAC